MSKHVVCVRENVSQSKELVAQKKGTSKELVVSEFEKESEDIIDKIDSYMDHDSDNDTDDECEEDMTARENELYIEKKALEREQKTIVDFMQMYMKKIDVESVDVFRNLLDKAKDYLNNTSSIQKKADFRASVQEWLLQIEKTHQEKQLMIVAPNTSDMMKAHDHFDYYGFFFCLLKYAAGQTVSTWKDFQGFGDIQSQIRFHCNAILDYYTVAENDTCDVYVRFLRPHCTTDALEIEDILKFLASILYKLCNRYALNVLMACLFFSIVFEMCGNFLYY